MFPTVQELANERALGSLLERIRTIWGPYEVRDHHQQGEFHHDLFLRVPGARAARLGEHWVVSTNCNGGIKELLCFDGEVLPSALWHARCPENPEFEGELPPLLGSGRTEHWFDPCGLLTPDARSELRPEFRQRQSGGGWCKK